MEKRHVERWIETIDGLMRKALDMSGSVKEEKDG
jgi:hypothetical protein